MDITWNYKIDLKTPEVFKEIEKERGISFPEDLKTFIIKANAATPSKYNFMEGPNERVFGSVLSFNHDEKNTDSVYTALAIIKDTNLIPFGIDPFGNYICYSVKDGMIIFWNHETDEISVVSKTLEDFLDSLF